MQVVDNLIKIKLMIPFFGAIVCFILAFCFIMVITGSSVNENVSNSDDFSVPFSEDVSFMITSRYGKRVDPFGTEIGFHQGVDLSAPDGTPILACADGTVIEIDKSGTTDLGVYVQIKHRINNKDYVTLYAHMLKKSLVVSEGQRVKSRQKIGIIGSTGRSTGVHLHLALYSPNVVYGVTNQDPMFIVE